MYEKFKNYLSEERLNTYINKFGKKNGVKYYNLNIIISHSFYVPLQFIEIALRNAINTELIKEFGIEWYLNGTLMSGENKEKAQYTIEKINQLIEKIKNRKIEKKLKDLKITNGDVVANLDFGFWTNLFCGNYANNIWSTSLKYIFKDFKRNELYKNLNQVREIRNRIFHYEPIIHDINNDIEKHSKLIFDLIEYLYNKKLSSYIYLLSDTKRFLSRVLEIITEIQKNPSAPLN